VLGDVAQGSEAPDIAQHQYSLSNK
jgi:hypothetical protein